MEINDKHACLFIKIGLVLFFLEKYLIPLLILPLLIIEEGEVLFNFILLKKP